jgi:hypothetical protein
MGRGIRRQDRAGDARAGGNAAPGIITANLAEGAERVLPADYPRLPAEITREGEGPP